MYPLIQCNIKNVAKIKVPMNNRPSVTNVFNIKSVLHTTHHDSYLVPKCQFLRYRLRNISASGRLHSNSSRPNSFDDSIPSENEDTFNSLSSRSTDITYSFRGECNKQEEFLLTQLQSKNERAEQTTNEDWKTMINKVLNMPGTINQKNINAVIMNKCSELKSLSLGKSYFKYLKSTENQINLATYGNYLLLFYSCRGDCNSDDMKEIGDIYKELLDVHPILDSHTAEKAISALSLTTNWKEYENLFIAIKRYYNPTVNIYRIIIQTAFDHQEFELGWKLMEEMAYLGLNVPEEIFLYLLQKSKHQNLEDNFTKILNFLNYFNLKPSDELCLHIKEVYEENNVEGRATFSRVSRNGECWSCHSMLEPCYISQEEYDDLKNAFLNPVIIGKDIFRKTKPDEFCEFLNLLKKSAPFDVVIDGLNTAYHGSDRSINVCTFRLKSVVRHFVSLKKKVLVLGRKHMAKWETPNMEYVYKNAHLFLADNVSQDDPFMLYAALYSGMKSCFVSKDLMRGHKCLLADPKLQMTFQKWQSQNQYFIYRIDNYGRVHFMEPVSFLQTIQRNSKGDWHVPFVVKGEDLTTRDRVDHLHRHWLCIQKKSPMAIPRQKRQKEASSKPKKVTSFPPRMHNTWEEEKPVRERDSAIASNSKMAWERSSRVKKSSGSINIKKLFREDN